MSNVYVIRGESAPSPVERVYCVNEDRELQSILERNPDLLPGDQIDPENPRRWLLIKREMPVPDPESGQDRWSVDLFLADQDAIPTFVECKRFADTRARREVVGQVLEYAANGHYYWSKDQLRTFAEETAARRGSDIADELRGLVGDENGLESADTYFERLQQNLREGQVRLIFFMEDSSMPLRSVVDFLNKQMEHSEVLIVEARQYATDGLRIVVPTLFGYTEQARMIKRTVTVSTSRETRTWDRQAYLEASRATLSEFDAAFVEAFYDRCLEIGYQVRFGTGKITGSINLKHPCISKYRSIISVFSTGQLNVNLGWLKETPEQLRVHARLKDFADQTPALANPVKADWPSSQIHGWRDHADRLMDVLRDVLVEAKR